MNALPHKIDEKIITHFEHVLPYLRVPSNEDENQKLIAHTRVLKEIIAKNRNAQPAKELLNKMYENIDIYEKQAYQIKHINPAEMLAFLMEQHDLTQSDLPEIGSQSHVSKILNGERNLTKDQIAAMSKRFDVSPSIFF